MRVKIKTGAAWALGLTLLVAAPAQAKKFVYSPRVVEGEKEVEYYVDWREDAAAADVVGHELAFEWGVDGRNIVALYGTWDDGPGEGPAYAGTKLEWIHTFFEPGERAWDFGTYLEYRIAERGGTDSAEFKALLEKTLPRTTLTLNGVVEKPVEAWRKSSPEVGYAARWAVRRWREVIPAVELYGNLGEVEDLKDWPETSQLLGPVVDLHLTRFVHWQVGALFGLTKDTENVRLKTQLAVEWY
jgi:hypothetical protein